LRAEYDAVALTIGAEQPRDLNVPGRELKGIYFAMDYLAAQNQRVSGESDERADKANASSIVAKSWPVINAQGKNVIVIGGGDTGSDCIGTARRQGALSIHQLEIQPQPPSTRSDTTPWPKWPLVLRVSHAHEEGAYREWSIATHEFRSENGNVSSLVAKRVPTGEEVELKAELVLLAMGFTGPDPSLLYGLEKDPAGRVKINSSFMTSSPGIFIAGDARIGASLIVWAIAEGRRMASGVERYLSRTQAKMTQIY
jgi:glutamate synthase (NADPH/NADH) small chain